MAQSSVKEAIETNLEIIKIAVINNNIKEIGYKIERNRIKIKNGRNHKINIIYFLKHNNTKQNIRIKKNTLDIFNSRLDIAKESINELENFQQKNYNMKHKRGEKESK